MTYNDPLLKNLCEELETDYERFVQLMDAQLKKRYARLKQNPTAIKMRGMRHRSHDKVYHLPFLAGIGG